MEKNAGSITCRCFVRLDIFFFYTYNPVFDSVLMRKVSQSAPVVDCETFVNFTNARYTIYFLVCEQIFLILAIGTICFDVQNPNASCRASVISVLV